MTYRPIFRDDGERPERRTTPDFSKFKVHDSYHKPVMDNLPPGDPADSKRLSRRWLEELDMRLSDRDKQVLASVRKYRYLMTGQIYRLHFTDVSKQAAFFILQKLRELHLLNTLSRRIGGVRAGSASLVWYLTHAGERLLRLRNDENDACRRFFEPSPFFLAHTLAVAEAAIQLSEICSATGMRLTALELEPDCWRNYRSRGVHRTLKPDLYAAAVSDDCEDRWFLEVDLDTESPKKVKEKCEWYHQYYRSGIEQEKYGMFPLTIWIVPNADRKERLLYHLREAFAAEPVKLFTVITIEELPVLLQKGGNPDAQC